MLSEKKFLILHFKLNIEFLDDKIKIVLYRKRRNFISAQMYFWYRIALKYYFLLLLLDHVLLYIVVHGQIVPGSKRIFLVPVPGPCHQSDISVVRHLTSPTKKVPQSDISVVRHVSGPTFRWSDKSQWSDMSMVRHVDSPTMTYPWSDMSIVRY